MKQKKKSREIVKASPGESGEVASGECGKVPQDSPSVGYLYHDE